MFWLPLSRCTARQAEHFFKRCYEAFVHGPFKVWAEYENGNGVPNFVTGEWWHTAIH